MKRSEVFALDIYLLKFKGNQRSGTEKKPCFVVALSASPDTAGRGSAKLCFARGDGPPLRAKAGALAFCFALL